MDNVTEQQLIGMALKGKRHALEQLLYRYQRKIYSQIVAQVSDFSEAYDLLQEVCLKVYRFIKNFNQRSSFSVWLYRITQNTIKNYYRWRATQLECQSYDFFEQVDETSNPEANLIGYELSESINKAVDHLPREMQRCLYLYLITGLDYDEIAQRLNCPPGTVRSRIHRMRSMIMMIFHKST